MERNARTKKLKIAIIAIALLLCLALAIGITTAFYQARRAVKGVVVFDQGIKFTITEVQDDSENNKGPYQLQYYSNKVVDDTEGNKIVLDTNVLPGEVLYVAIPTVNPASDTVPFALRAKLSYIYKDAEGQALDINSLTARQALFQTLYDGNSAIDFGNNWLYDTTTDYFYYVNNESNGLKLSNIAKITGETSPFGVFNDNLSGASKLEMNQDFGDIEAGGPIVEGHEIRTVEIVLDLEFIQYVEQSIIDIWGDSSVVVDENGVLTSATGFLVDEVIVPEVVDGKTVTQVGYGDTSATINAQNLVLPQTVTKIAAFSFPETTKDMTVRFDSSSTLSSGASFRVSTLDGETTYDLSIGAGAFAGCPNLIVSIPSGKTYKIANNAFDDSAKILVGDSNVARNWSEIKNNAASYGITLFEPKSIPNGDNNPNKGSSGTGITYYDTIDYVSEDGMWGYCIEDTDLNKSGKCIRIVKYYGTESDLYVPRTLGDDLNGVYQVLYIGSENSENFKGTYAKTGASLYSYDPVFTGQFNSITLPEGVMYADMAVGVSLYYRYLNNAQHGYEKGDSHVDVLHLPSTFKGFYDNLSLNIAYFDVSAANQELCSVDGVLYSKDLKTLIKYPDLKSNDSFIVPSSVENISAYVFYRAENLQNLTINNNVKEINHSALSDLDYILDTLTYNANAIINDGREIKNYMYLSYGVKNIIIGDEVTGCVKFYLMGGEHQSISIGKNVESLDFTESSSNYSYEPQYFIISPENKTITKDDNFIYNSLTGEMYYVYNQPKGDFTIPEYITSIPDYAFSHSNNTELTSLIIGDQVTSIGFYALEFDKYTSSTDSLSTIVLPSHLTELPRLSRRSGLRTINIPNGIKNILTDTFVSCTSLESIVLPDGLESIGSYAFKGCSSLTTINLPEGLKTINSHAFEECSSLISIIIPSTVSVIGDYAFQNCTNLADVKYAISYDLNGVEADPIERVFVAATLNASGGLDGKVTTEITLPAAPTNATRTFLGWYDGTETKSAGTTCTPIRRKIVAVWEGIGPKYIITLDAKDGEGTYTMEAEANKSFILPDFTGFKKEGYFPYSWYFSGNTYNPGDAITPTSDMTIYVSYINSNFYASGSMGNYSPEYIFSKEKPQYGDSIEISFEIPSKFKISQIRYSVDNMQNYKVVECQYPVCGETVTVTIDKITYYTIRFQFDVADEYVEFIFDYEREGIEPVTIGGWLNDSSYKFVAPSSMILDGQSIKGWEKRNVSYPPFISCGEEFTPYTRDRSAGTYYAVWEDARIVSGSASTDRGGEEDLRLKEEFMRAYYDLINKANSGDYTEEEITAMQQEFMQSDVYFRYMGVNSVSYDAYVSGLVKSGDVYITCDSALLKTEAYQVTGTDGAYASELYEVLMRYTNESDINTYEYLYLKCTKGVDGEGNTIFFRNETTNSCAGQYMTMQLYICLRGKSFIVNPNDGGGENKTITAYATKGAMLPTNLTNGDKVLVGFSKNQNAVQGDDDIISTSTKYIPENEGETLYAIWRNAKTIIFKDPNGVGEDQRKSEYKNRYGEQCIDLLTSCPYTIPERHFFKGWVQNVGDATYYEDGDYSKVLKLPGDEIVLYANFVENPHIILNANDGSGQQIKAYTRNDSTNYVSVSLIDYQNAFSIEGKKIIGWATTEGATVVQTRYDSYYNDYYSANNVVTLYAVWSN